MRIALPIIACVAIAHAAATARAQQPPRFNEVTMFIGEQRVLEAGDILSYSEGTAGVVQVKIPRDATKMVLTAVKAGSTSLLFMRRGDQQETWLITVYTRPPEAVKRDLGQLLAEVPGIRVREVGSRIFIEGRVPNEAYQQRCAAVAKEYGDQVVSLVQTDPTRVEKRVNIKLDVHFVEFTKNEGYSVGTNWPAQFSAASELSATYDLTGGGTQAATYSITSSALVGLDLLSFWGWAKIRKHSTLVTTNGVKAHYAAGGEINVAVTGIGGGTLQKIPFGTDVTITPRFDPSTGRIDLDVEAEASELTARASTEAPPGRTLSNVKTTVHLEMGQAVMLSGIQSQTAREGQRGLPLLRHIPILGYLFRTDTVDQQENEGAIYITPTIVDEVRDSDRRELDRLLKKFEKFEG